MADGNIRRDVHPASGERDDMIKAQLLSRHRLPADMTAHSISFHDLTIVYSLDSVRFESRSISLARSDFFQSVELVPSTRSLVRFFSIAVRISLHVGLHSCFIVPVKFPISAQIDKTAFA